MYLQVSDTKDRRVLTKVSNKDWSGGLINAQCSEDDSFLTTKCQRGHLAPTCPKHCRRRAGEKGCLATRPGLTAHILYQGAGEGHSQVCSLLLENQCLPCSNQATGEAGQADSCSKCHGEQGTGAVVIHKPPHPADPSPREVATLQKFTQDPESSPWMIISFLLGIWAVVSG